MKLVLDRWQGLGDNLQVSTIPRRYFEKYGEKCVWISDAVYYRSPEIKKLVWENNPYIAGFTNEPGENYTNKIQFGKYNWIEQWERIYNLDGPYSSKPELYCKKLDKDVFNTSKSVVFDISYSKDSYNQNINGSPVALQIIERNLNSFRQQTDCEFIQIHNTELNKNEQFINFLNNACKNLKVKTVEVTGIEEYCNAVKWAKQFVCTHSGCHVLAAAIRDKSICFIPEKYLNMNYFVFNNVRYIPI
jgi:hypothetical protein